MKFNISNWSIDISLSPKVSLFLIALITISAVSMLGALSTQAINEVIAQQLEVKEQTMYYTDINVHFKTACISVIIFTYCW